jgi:hypothetical protein
MHSNNTRYKKIIHTADCIEIQGKLPKASDFFRFNPKRMEPLTPIKRFDPIEVFETASCSKSISIINNRI